MARVMRKALLGVALVSAAIAWWGPVRPAGREIADALVVVDITRSMNVRDYRWEGRSVSRLEFVAAALKQILAELPCGSRVGLGLFTERRVALLYRPIEVCKGYPVLAASLDAIDWRMAWAADSRIADGLYDGMKLLAGGETDLLFLTDGQEAPPRNPRYRPPFADIKGKAQGVVVGVGGLTLSPIPKFDEKGEPAGFYGPEEVPHQSRFGLPERAPEGAEGYHARNAPFGGNWELGHEHLSSLKEDYLRELARVSGLAYRRLERPGDLLDELHNPARAHRQTLDTDVAWLYAGLALASLAAFYLADLYSHAPLKRHRF
ncbi:VWA domain-containing protein [Methylococcus sp. EFPC2]|uniref:VWA domain-containing protein n=1 Tax=Methylococcus sp. EFPC2 TaxID=2812648 RepID=UPI0019688DD2|nr:VWA domain-containing protein [Methylococcus sp. EFPC2]QSA97379.1 VWA domain-containing protein [Methylococcus sp. EFPC2]